MNNFVEYKELIPHLIPGDLIEIKRKNYYHWVLFHKKSKGHYWCHHVIAGQSIKAKTARLRYDPLFDILYYNKDRVTSMARINNKEEEAQRRGCRPNDLEKVFDLLKPYRNVVTEVRYNIVTLNCEHYVTQWKYGNGWSKQIYDIRVLGKVLKSVITSRFTNG